MNKCLLTKCRIPMFVQPFYLSLYSRSFPPFHRFSRSAVLWKLSACCLARRKGAQIKSDPTTIGDSNDHWVNQYSRFLANAHAMAIHFSWPDHDTCEASAAERVREKRPCHQKCCTACLKTWLKLWLDWFKTKSPVNHHVWQEKMGFPMDFASFPMVFILKKNSVSRPRSSRSTPRLSRDRSWLCDIDIMVINIVIDIL